MHFAYLWDIFSFNISSMTDLLLNSVERSFILHVQEKAAAWNLILFYFLKRKNHFISTVIRQKVTVMEKKRFKIRKQVYRQKSKALICSSTMNMIQIYNHSLSD